MESTKTHGEGEEENMGTKEEREEEGVSRLTRERKEEEEKTLTKEPKQKEEEEEEEEEGGGSGSGSGSGSSPCEGSLAHPLRRRSAYMFYCKDHRESLRQQNPDLKITEILKMLGEGWRGLPIEEKNKYQQLSEEDAKRYENEMSAYNSQLPPAPKGAKKAAKKEKAGKLKTMEVEEINPEKPKKKGKGITSEQAHGIKRPQTAFMYFAQRNRAQIRDENPSMPFSEIAMAIAKKWKDLPEEEKKEFEETAKADVKRYKDEVAAHCGLHDDDSLPAL
jgi:hypothetical protein